MNQKKKVDLVCIRPSFLKRLKDKKLLEMLIKEKNIRKVQIYGK